MEKIKNILISGANGFVGKNIIRYLCQNKHSLILLTRNIENNKRLNYEFSLSTLKYQQLDIECLNQVETFIHLAGKAHDLKKVSNPQLYFEVNTDLTIRLFDAFLASSCKTFIYFSSVKAAADTVAGVLTEDEIPNPKTPYGQSKLQAERYLLDHTPSDKHVIILRPCMIHGPRNKGNLNLLFTLVKRGIPYPLGVYQNKRSLLSINNLNFVIEKLLLNPIRSGVYNIADDEAISTNRIIEIMAYTLNKKSRIWTIPESIIKSAAILGDFTKLPLNSESLQKLTESYVVSNNKIKKELGIDRLPFTVEEGLELTIQSFLNEGVKE